MSSPVSSSGSDGIYLLDTSVLILSLRGDAAIASRINSVGTVYVSSIVLGELYFGAYNSPTRPDAAVIDVDNIASAIVSLVADATTGRIYGQIKRELRRKGYTMPDNDLWIAATAIQYDLTLVARDAHFDWVDGLRVEQW